MAKAGTVVISLSGKDRGRLLAVLGGDDRRVLVVDGKHRKLGSPKAKKSPSSASDRMDAGTQPDADGPTAEASPA